jgi:hypothetical protein
LVISEFSARSPAASAMFRASLTRAKSTKSDVNTMHGISTIERNTDTAPYDDPFLHMIATCPVIRPRKSPLLFQRHC